MTTCVRVLLLAAACLSIARVWGVPAAAVHLDPGDLVVVDAGAAAPSVPARVIRIDPVSGVQDLVASGGYLSEPFAIAFEPAGTLLVADGGGAAGGALVRIDPANGDQSLLGDGSPLGVAVDRDTGEVFITNGFDAGVLAVDPSTGATTPVSSGPPLDFTQSIVEGTDGHLYVADFDVAWGLVRVDREGGGASPLAATLGFVGGLAASPGAVWVTQPDQASIVRVALPSGNVTPVTSGNELRFPVGVAAEANGALVVADWGDTEVGPAIVRVVPETGAQGIVAEGGFLTEPWGIAVVAPEPASLPVAITGCAVLLLWRRARPRA